MANFYLKKLVERKKEKNNNRRRCTERRNKESQENKENKWEWREIDLKYKYSELEKSILS